MDTGNLRTELLPPDLTPTSPSADDHRPMPPAERKQRRRPPLDDEGSEDTSSEASASGEHRVDRLA